VGFSGLVTGGVTGAAVAAKAGATITAGGGAGTVVGVVVGIMDLSSLGLDLVKERTISSSLLPLSSACVIVGSLVVEGQGSGVLVGCCYCPSTSA
jgi:hypothetical protein